MKVFIEASALYRSKSGVGYYLYHLLDALAKLAPQHQFVAFNFFFWGRKEKQVNKKPRPNLSVRHIRFLPGKIYYNLQRRLWAPPIDLLLGEKPDLFIFPNFVRWPLLFKHKSITFVYDLSFIHAGEHSFSNERKFLAKKMPQSIAKSDRIITISRSSKRELIDHYQVDPAKIDIAYPATDPTLFYPRTPRQIKAIKQKHGITSSYLLFTGTIEPRKNVDGLLEAYAALPDAMKRESALVLAGGKGWNDQAILNLIAQRKAAGDNIISLGYVPEKDLPALYSGAKLFIFPSHYEGFGMPVLEAMACGVPVICANNTSLPEVAGEAAILIESKNIASITEAIHKVLTDTTLRQALANRGLDQAKTFSWEESAKTVLKVIEEVGAK